MSKILKIDDGDYVVQVQPGGYIILDAGEVNGVKGTVTIKGDLDVQGQRTQVLSTDTTISDNIFTLNTGEIGPGVNVPIKAGLSGFKIDRGGTGGSTVTTVNGATVTTPIGDPLTAQLLFSETTDVYDPKIGTRSAGTFLLQTSIGAVDALSKLKLNSAELSAISNDGTTSIEIDLRNSEGVVTLVNSTYTTASTLYHERVTDDSLVNKKFVTSYITAGLRTLGMADVDKIYKLKLDNSEASQVLASLTSVDVSISSTTIASITSNGLNVNTISPYNGDLVTLDAVLGLTDQPNDPTVVSNTTQLFSKATVGSGNSGLFFNNSTVSGELVANNRALLLSMLF